MCQALDLDRRNVDGWVARGAAYANQHAFPKAVSDFQTALGVRHYEAAQHTVQGPCTCVFCCCTAAFKPDAAVTQQMLAISVVMCFCTAGHEGLSHNCSHNCSSILYTKLPSSVSSALVWTHFAEMEPGHVNASKYLRVTEQHMTQLGLPIAASLQQPVLVDNIRAAKRHHQAVEQDAPVQPAAAQIDLTTTGMSSFCAACVRLQPISICVILFALCLTGEACSCRMQSFVSCSSGSA